VTLFYSQEEIILPIVYGKTIWRFMAILYIVDILYYTIIDDSWGIGVANFNYCEKKNIKHSIVEVSSVISKVPTLGNQKP